MNYKNRALIFKSTLNTLLTLATLTLFSSQANATLVLQEYTTGTPTPGTIDVWNMTDFALENTSLSGSTTTVTAPSGDNISFVDKNNNPLGLNRNLADSVSWWNNGESFDYDVYTTDENLIKILLPANTRAFSFNVGANLNSTGLNAWIMATETNGLGIDSKYRFNVNKNNTPGFGIYSEVASDGSCSALTSVTIEPDYWGVGNFSIHQGDCASVPEPATNTLFGLGLISLIFGRRFTKNMLTSSS